MANKVETVCPCCKQPVTVEYKPTKWQGEQDKVIITHKKWQEKYRNNMNLSRR